MERAEFLKQLGSGAVAVCAYCGLVSCSDDNDSVTPTNGVDFTINIEDASFSPLKSVGGFVYKDGLIIARTGTDSFVALSKSCTHNNVAVEYSASASKMICNAHGSEFSTSGAVLRGPAQVPLRSYNTSFKSPELRVFS